MMNRNTKIAAVSPRQQKRCSFRLSVPMRLLCAFLVALLFCACAGGSGSSGFDASPSAENEVINQVLTTRQCEPGEELTICPANEEALHVPGTDQMPIPPEFQVSTGLNPAEIARCAETDERTCRLAVQIAIIGLPTGAGYQLAARGLEPSSTWTVSGPAVTLDELGATELTAVVDVPAASTLVQLAVLVFDSGVGTTVGEILTLAETGASFAFVADPVPISVESSLGVFTGSRCSGWRTGLCGSSWAEGPLTDWVD